MGKDPGATQPEEDPPHSVHGSHTEANSRAHAPIRLLFDTKAEQLSLSLHQLQPEVQRLTILHNNRQEGTGGMQSQRKSPGQEPEAQKRVARENQEPFQ